MNKIKYTALFICLFTGCGLTIEKPNPKFIEVICSECNGIGKVTYNDNHPIVKMGFDAGTFNCPMCNGSGKLYEELRYNP